MNTILWLLSGIGIASTVPTSPLVIFDSKEYSHITFQMKHGACLRGPLVFYDRDGKEQFKLDAGAEYPSGCSTR